MTVYGSLHMESPRLKEAVYWGMTSHFGRLGTHVWNVALSITLSSLKLMLQMLILTNVCRFGALSAHMWPGMILKSGNKIAEPSLPERPEDLSDEESDYEFEYEFLSAGSADPFDDSEEWVSANGLAGPSVMRGLAAQSNLVLECKQENGTSSNKEVPHALNSTAALDDSISKGVSSAEEPEQDAERDQAPEPDEGTNFEYEDLDQLMSEIGNMRDSLRLLPDF